jgi:hypothetical protein
MPSLLLDRENRRAAFADANDASIVKNIKKIEDTLPHCVAGLELLFEVDYELTKGFEHLSNITASIVHESRVIGSGNACCCLPPGTCCSFFHSSTSFSNFSAYSHLLNKKSGNFTTTLIPADPTAKGDLIESRYYFKISGNYCCGCLKSTPFIRELVVLPAEVLRTYMPAAQVPQIESPKVISTPSKQVNSNPYAISQQQASPYSSPYVSSQHMAVVGSSKQASNHSFDNIFQPAISGGAIATEGNVSWNHVESREKDTNLLKTPDQHQDNFLVHQTADHNLHNQGSPKIPFPEELNSIYHSGEDESFLA